MIERRYSACLAVLIFALAGNAFSHTIPDNVTAQVFLHPSDGRLFMLVRIPFDALADTVFPSRADGDLDLPEVDRMLPDQAKTWVTDWIDMYEGDALLAKARVAETRVSLGSDNSFRSYEDAWAHVTGARLPSTVQVYPDRAMFDVLLEYQIRSDRSAFAIHSRLARLGGTVVTVLRFVTPGGQVRTFAYEDDPGRFLLDPGWSQAAGHFLGSGVMQILQGSDYLLFLFCAALLYRRIQMKSLALFVAASSLALIGSAYGLVPDAIWFPVLFETLIAASIVYLALESIVRGGWIPAPVMATVFGLIYGFGFSFGLRETLRFGGAWVLTSVVSYTAGVEAAVCLALAAFAVGLHLLFRFAARAERIGTIFLAALAAHTGWHRMLDRAQWLRASQIPWPSFGFALASLAAGLAFSAFRVYTRQHARAA